MPGSYVLSGIETNFFECPICLENYENPKTLTCGHTFCGKPRQCMEGLENDEGILCPLCRTQHQVREADVQTSIFIRAVIESSHRQPSTRASLQATETETELSDPIADFNWTTCEIVVRAATTNLYSTVTSADQRLFFVERVDSETRAIRSFAWIESEAGIQLLDEHTENVRCQGLQIAATNNQNGTILMYAAIKDSNTRMWKLFAMNAETLMTGRELSIPPIIKRNGDMLTISAWENYLAVCDLKTCVVMRGGEVVSRLDTDCKGWYGTLSRKHLVVTIGGDSTTVYAWQGDDGTVLANPALVNKFDGCAGLAKCGNTLIARHRTLPHVVRIDVPTGVRETLSGDAFFPICFLRHDMVAGFKIKNGKHNLVIAKLS